MPDYAASCYTYPPHSWNWFQTRIAPLNCSSLLMTRQVLHGLTASENEKKFDHVLVTSQPVKLNIIISGEPKGRTLMLVQVSTSDIAIDHDKSDFVLI